MERSDIFELRQPKGVGHEQRGRRFGVVVQSDALLPRSVVLIAPTSTSARAASFRPLQHHVEAGRQAAEIIATADGDVMG